MTAAFGAFGKMPALGDFVRLGLPASFITPWDAWLQSGLAELKSSLGERWQECFFSAPIWRFSVAAGLAGETAMQGVLMASVDRVGRQFPLTIAAPIAGGIGLSHLASGTAFTGLEDIALATLEDDATKDRLTEQLTAQPPWPPVPPRHGDNHAIVANGPGLATHLAAEAPALQSARSLWSTVMEGEERLLTCASLPNPSELRALFDLDAPLWQTAA